MPLKVVLRPGEKVIVNGAVLGAGERTVTLFLHNRAAFLRGRDILKETDVVSLETALYFLVQLLYIFPEDAAVNRPRVALALGQLRAERPEAAATLDEVAALVAGGGFYRALKLVRRLFPDARPAEGAPPCPPAPVASLATEEARA
ncbi:MAG: flagellar biosynthesis repressor FlbT [Alphaproteobacteria bacterium]|nr:flagellar biosynthesis repressor FlbT [Alphaproteobacteria bacterium]